MTIYGMGVDTLSQRINKPVAEAAKIQNELFDNLPKIKRFIEEKGQYCVDNKGLCDSVLGDVLYMENDAEARLSRLGVNQIIQNFASVSLAQGFQNTIRHSILDRNMIVRPFNVVHDSSQNYFETKKLFEISDFYRLYLTEYLYELYKVRYEFDLEIGINYYDLARMKQLSPTVLSFKGTHKSLQGLLRQCTLDGLKYKVQSLKNLKVTEGDGIILDPKKEFKPIYKDSVMDKFYVKTWDGVGQAIYDMDYSKYEVVIEKI
jgi:DNA polymerase I - 3''-5'' exonuclease and polymerase domains